MATIGFTSRITGLKKVASTVAAITLGVRKALGQGRIEELLLARVKGRFEPRGSTETAQTAPDGRLWKPVSAATVASRKRNRNRMQALSDTKALQNAIKVLQDNVSLLSLISAAGGSFSIGVHKSHPRYAAAQLHNRGGRTPRGGLVPRRQFIGIGKGELASIGTLVKETILRELGR